eukprot:4029215-Pleurochrysis_carterae.AAC.14
MRVRHLLWSGRRRGGQLEVAHDEARGQTGAETELGAVIQLLERRGAKRRVMRSTHSAHLLQRAESRKGGAERPRARAAVGVACTG